MSQDELQELKKQMRDLFYRVEIKGIREGATSGLDPKQATELAVSLITAQRESWEREARMNELNELGYQTATNGWHKGKASLMWKYVAERQAQLKAEPRKESDNA